MGLWKGIKAILEGWERIDNPPEWVLKAYYEWERKLPTHPYNMTKHFVGRTFVYRVRHGMGAQGEAPILGWYKKLSNKKD
ncbi:MAG: hypothetical protein WDZ69_00510 [Candidatus Pacearchaeota archaeon]